MNSSFFLYKKIIDISLPLKQKMVIYPGNPALEIEQFGTPSGNVLSKITFGSHTGTHIDAPAHCITHGKTLDKLDLKNFIGWSRVLDLTKSLQLISVKDLERKKINKGERILLKTSNSLRVFLKFNPDFVYLSGEAAAYLAQKKVSLVGIDSLSIKQKGSLDNSPHTNLLMKDIPILEGIDLSNCEEGEYFLVVLPLRFALDGSPARVVLLR